jgi:ubiquinone/menaquinone biosynthesis C-methylase UbiE
MADTHAAFEGSIPEFYDGHLGPVLFQPYAADLAARLTLKGAARVLEIACGTGIVTRALRERLPAEAELIATDLNEAMVAYARGKPGASRGVEWRLADAAALPFPDASFDAAVCQFGVMFVPEKAAAFREAKRVLKPRGTFAFNVWDRMEENDLGRVAHETIADFFPSDPPQFYTVPFGFHDPEEIRSHLAAAGFRDVRVEPVALNASISSAQHVAVGLIRGNPVSTAIRDRGGEVETVIEALTAALTKRLGGDPPKARMRALVVLAA